MKAPLRTLFANGLTLFGGNAAAMGLSLLQTLILARTLGPAQFGVWSSVQAFVLVAYSLCTFRTSEPVTRYLVDIRHQGDRSLLELLLGSAVVTDAVTRCLSVVVVAALVPWVAASLPGGAEAGSLYLLVALGQLGATFDQVWFSVARDLGRYRAIATLNAVFPLLRVVGFCGLSFVHALTLPAVAWLFLAVGGVQALVTALAFGRALSDGYGLRARALVRSGMLRRRHEIAPFWGFMTATFFSSICSSMLKEADTLILGAFRSAEDVGYYRLSKSLANTVMKIGEMLSQVIYQDFSELVVRREMAEVRHRIISLCRTFIPIVAIATIVCVILAYPLIVFGFGAAFGPSVRPFQILLVASGIVTMVFWVRPIVLALELYWYNFRITVFQSLILMPLNVIMCYSFGVMGATLTLALSWIVGYAALLWPVFRRFSKGINREDHGGGQCPESAGVPGSTRRDDNALVTEVRL